MSSSILNLQPAASPFELANTAFYQRWRDKKLAGYPTSLEQLLVEVNDPRRLSQSEYQKLLDVCRKTNMVLYASKTGDDPDPEIPLAIGRSFNVHELDHNWLADESGLTSLTVVNDGSRKSYIPYTNRAINWHTDGYYNPANRQIHALLLHCVHPAAQGGSNRLMDHEIAYIKLREKNPDYISALMAPDVMTIPPRVGEQGVIARQQETGPVFSINPATGDLHMRYTIRTHNIIWKDDELTREAIRYLEDLLENDSEYSYQGTLQSGMGLISNNVLHDRSGFEDGEVNRLLYRARYYARLNDSSVNQVYND